MLLVLGACTGQAPRPAPHAAPAAAPASRTPAPGAVKVGNPYQVLGKWYYPADDHQYDERGVASWYGPGFHTLFTANGERYDQDGISAAHKTLPMPSYVEVENVDNGRKLTVRINDRGPFVDGRIIDLSRRAAQLLGVDRPGTAHVRVRRVFPDGATLASLAPPPPPANPTRLPAPMAASLPLGLPPVAPGAAAPPAVATIAIPGGPPAAAAVPATGGASYVQVAALADAGRIAWLRGYLAAFGNVVVEAGPAGLTRIRLGPYSDTAAANAALAQVRAAGYSDARLIPPKPSS